MKQRTKNIIGWILTGLLVLIYAFVGFSKLFGAEMQLENLRSWGYPLWMRFPIGLGEVLLAIGLSIPRFRYFAVLGIFPWAVVAIYTHIQANPPQYQMLGAPILFAIMAWGIIAFLKPRNKTTKTE